MRVKGCNRYFKEVLKSKKTDIKSQRYFPTGGTGLPIGSAEGMTLALTFVIHKQLL